VFEIEHEVYEKGSLHWPLSRRGKGLPQNIEIKRYVWHSPPKEGGKLHVKTWISMRLAPVFRPVCLIYGRPYFSRLEAGFHELCEALMIPPLKTEG